MWVYFVVMCLGSIFRSNKSCSSQYALLRSSQCLYTSYPERLRGSELMNPHSAMPMWVVLWVGLEFGKVSQGRDKTSYQFTFMESTGLLATCFLKNLFEFRCKFLASTYTNFFVLFLMCCFLITDFQLNRHLQIRVCTAAHFSGRLFCIHISKQQLFAFRFVGYLTTMTLGQENILINSKC